MESEDIRTSQTKIGLKQRLSYLHLATALIPAFFNQEDLRATLNELAVFIDTASPSDLQLRAKELLRRLDPAIAMANHRLRPLKSWEDIAADYWQLSSQTQLSFQRGISLEWLARRFDVMRALGVPADLPFHAQIGIANHAGTAAVEEDFLLRDSFYLLAKVHQQFNWLQRYVEAQKTEPVSGFAKISAMLSDNVTVFARQAVKSFYSFLECFVNSVGEDFIARAETLTPAEQECLRGKKKGAYLRLDAKIERFPGIIRGDKKRPLVLSDPAQIREPFVSLSRITELRDAAMHYAKQKEEIWRSPQEWNDLADLAAKTCVACARDFWTVCYPSRALPQYLFGFDEARHRDLARERLELELVASRRMVSSASAGESAGASER